MGNLILARILAQGAQSGVIDRAGRYEFLASLIPDATVINLGTAGGQAINPWDVDDVRRVGPEKLEYLLALHSFFLGRPLRTGPTTSSRAITPSCHWRSGRCTAVVS